MGTSITRRAKWQYPPPQPTPRILHLPRLPRKKAPTKLDTVTTRLPKERKGMQHQQLESLFGEERSFTRGTVPVVLVSSSSSSSTDEERRRRVAEESSVVVVEEEKWRFQAEMLRAECNLLRMERKIVVKKMERRRVHMERTLKSALQILLSGRKNICGGKDVNLVLLEEQINEMVEKIEKLEKRSCVKDLEVKKCSDFDKQVSDEEICVKEIRERMEEYSDLPSSSLQQLYKEKMPHEPSVCSGHCKAMVQRIVEQVGAEMEQWSQMQEMLGMVRDEMEELQASREFWEDRAIDSDYQIQSLQSAVKEWRQKAYSSEGKTNELQAQVYVLHREIERSKQERDRKLARAKIASPINQEAQNETEKRVLVCRLKESDRSAKEVLRDGRRKPQTCTSGLLRIRRSPLGEIGNMSILTKQQQQQQQQQRQHGEGILPLFILHEAMKR